MITIEPYLVGIAVLLVLSVIASKLSDRAGIPALLVFLGIGMLAGSDGPGGIYFDDPVMAQAVGMIALVVILFSGGLDTHWESVRTVLGVGLVLATVGVLITAVVLGLAAHWVLNVTLLEGILLGAIVSSTDAAAVFALLRSRGVRLGGRLEPLLELEAGSNDPMAVFLTVGLIGLIQQPEQGLGTLALGFFRQMLIGAVTGYAGGRLLLAAINRLRLGYAGMYPVLVFGVLLLVFGVTNLLGGSGFLAVYGTGLVLGRAEFLHKRSVLRFYEGLAWLMQIFMFLTLGLLVFPSRLVGVIGPGLALAAVLILVARPIGVWVGLLFSRFSNREKALIAWVGLRGAVPIVLATYPRLAGLEQSELIFNVIFFVVITSVLVQGTTISHAARLLKVDKPAEESTVYPLEEVPREGWKALLRETVVPEDSWAVGKAIFQLGLPMNYLIVLIARQDRFVIPNGSVVIEAGDRILGLAVPEMHETVRARLAGGAGGAEG